MASRKLEVEIIGDASSLTKAFGKAGSASTGFGSKLGSVAKYAGLAIGGAALGGLAVVLKQGATEFAQSSKVAAQTGAVLKSTGGAANVTSKQVDSLANSIMRYSGMDDEAVKSGENMLLTFTNIQNRVGKTNDIFNQATTATADLSVAMGIDMTKAALQVGKALNDPVKGMTRLQRVGVTFTDAQKDAVAAMVKTGDTAGAQKVILAELTKEFGGSAKAAGDTLPGQLSKLKETFNNLAGTIVGGMAPALSAVAGHLTTFIGKVQDAHGISGKLGVVWDTLKSSAVSVGNGIKDAFNAIDWTEVGHTVMDGIKGALKFLEGVDWGGILRNVGTRLLDGLKTVFSAIDWAGLGHTIGTALVSALNKIGEFVRSVDWGKVGHQLVQGLMIAIGAIGVFLLSVNWGSVLASIGRGIIAILKGLGSLLLGIATEIGKMILHGIEAGAKAAWNQLKSWLSSLGGKIKGLFTGAAGWLRDAGLAVLQGLWDGLRAKWDAVSGWLSGLGGRIKDLKGPVDKDATLLQPAGTAIMKGFHDALVDEFFNVDAFLQTVAPKLRDRMSAAIDAAKRAIDAKRGALAESFSRLSAKIFSAFDAETSAHQTPAEKLIADMTDRRQMEDLQKALTDALEGGDPQAILRAQEDIQMLSLQKQADAERQNYDARRDNLRQSLEDRLAALQTHYTKEGATVGEATKGITKLLASFGLDFESVGGVLGTAFVAGLKKAIASAGTGASALEKTIANVSTKIPGRGGAAVAMAGGGVGTVTRPTLFLAGEAGREQFAFSGAGKSFGGGGGGNVTVNLPNYLGSVQDVAETIRRELLRTGQRNGSILGGMS